jgi:major membrane immunogen (membrane-anchored lipoprotein)
MKGLTLIFLLCAALLLVACGSSSSVSSTGTGVAACDEYLAKADKCMNSPNMPEDIRNEYKKTMEQNRGAWKQAASTAEGRAELEKQCKMVLDSQRTMLDNCK